MINPAFLCRQHLLGEHNEIHRLAGSIRAGRSLGKLLTLRRVAPQLARSRHEVLVVEMLKRGYNHRSPLPEFEIITEVELNPEENLRDLTDRCPECRRRVESYRSRIC